jgi:hypothetical protein
MAMELLTFHDQLIADFSPDDQEDNFVFLDIIQATQVTCPKLELGQRIRTRALDRLRGRRGLVLQPGHDCRFQDSLVTDRQRSQLPFGFIGDRNPERHDTDSGSLTR